MPLQLPTGRTDHRNLFADFLERLAASETAGDDWSTHCVAHYADDKLEAIRRDVVRLSIERNPLGSPLWLPADREWFREMAKVLRSPAVA